MDIQPRTVKNPRRERERKIAKINEEPKARMLAIDPMQIDMAGSILKGSSISGELLHKYRTIDNTVTYGRVTEIDIISNFNVSMLLISCGKNFQINRTPGHSKPDATNAAIPISFGFILRKSSIKGIFIFFKTPNDQLT